MKNSIDKILTNKSFNFWKKKYNIGSFFFLTCNAPDFKSCSQHIRTFSVSSEVDSFQNTPDIIFHQNSTYLKWFFYKFNLGGKFRFCPNTSEFPEKGWHMRIGIEVKRVELYCVEVMQNTFRGMGSINSRNRSSGSPVILEISKKSDLKTLILFFDLFHFALSPEKSEEFKCFKEAFQVYQDKDMPSAVRTQKLLDLRDTRREIKAKNK